MTPIKDRIFSAMIVWEMNEAENYVPQTHKKRGIYINSLRFQISDLVLTPGDCSAVARI
jgi:hypothetical protein